MINYRKARKFDILEMSKLFNKLHTASTFEELFNENSKLIENENNAFFLAFDNEKMIACAHATIRKDYVEGIWNLEEGCGYLEGIFVLKEYRNLGIAKHLVQLIEDWIKHQGITQFASDCQLNNTMSQKFHTAIGFEEADKIIHFIKKI